MNNPRPVASALFLLLVAFSVEPAWSGPPVEFENPSGVSPFRRSDANADERLDIADAVATLDALFHGEQLECADAADSNDDGLVNLTDVIYTLDYMFLSGPVPPAPGPGHCAFDPTPDDLPCEPVLACRVECLGIICNGICVDTNWDSGNCGGCGNVCPPLSACSAGVCEGLCINCGF